MRASEGYCLPAQMLADPACPAIHALRDLYLLQLDQVGTEVFVLPSATLDLCRAMLEALELVKPPLLGDVMPALEGSAALGEYLKFFQSTRDGRHVCMVEIVF